MNAFSMAIKSIRRNKARSILTMLGIVIGITAVVAMVSLVQGMQKKVMESMNKFGTNIVNVYSWSQVNLTDRIQNKCDELAEHIEGMSPASQTNTSLRYLTKSLQNATIYFGSETYDVCAAWELDSGRMFTRKEAERRGRVCVVGAGVVDALFNYEDPIGKQLKINGEVFEIIGTFKLKFELNQEWSMDNMVVVPYTNNRLLMDSTQVTDYVIKCKNSKSTKIVCDELNDAITPYVGSYGYFNAWSNTEYIEQSNSTMKIIQIVLGGIAGISLLVGGIGIMNIMLVSVTERTREIGIRKAIGAKRRAIVVQFLIESATVSLFGGLIGIALGFLITVVLGKILFDTIVLPSAFFTLLSAAFSVFIGIFFGFYPANRASKLNPIDALRNE